MKLRRYQKALKNNRMVVAQEKLVQQVHVLRVSTKMMMKRKKMRIKK